MQKKKFIPLFLTEEYITTSCDVYPLEYLKMKKKYEVIYGKNILKTLNIQGKNIRLESEQKIKGALIRMTQVILENGNNRKNLARTSFLAMDDIESGMEGLLELAGISDYNSSLSMIHGVEQQFGIGLQSFKDIVNWKNGVKPQAFKKLIYDFYEKIEELAALVDRINTNEK